MTYGSFLLFFTIHWLTSPVSPVLNPNPYCSLCRDSGPHSHTNAPNLPSELAPTPLPHPRYDTSRAVGAKDVNKPVCVLEGHEGY